MRNKGIRLLEQLQASGRRVFTVTDARERLGVSRFNSLRILGNLKRQKRILTLTHGLYALWHPSERKWGLRPLPILDSLMNFRKMPYYIGLLSAADYHGAAHHKPQVLQVVIPKQLSLRKASQLHISFHVKKKFPIIGLEKVMTESGTVYYSSPELTALDVIYYQSACAGFGNVCIVVHDLISHLDGVRLKKMIEEYPYAACVQRLGFLMEYFGADLKLLKPLQQWVKRKQLVPVALSPDCPKKGKIHKNWQVIENAKVETEP